MMSLAAKFGLAFVPDPLEALDASGTGRNPES